MINTVMRTSLKLCTMKSLPVLKKNSNTQGKTTIKNQENYES